MLFPLRFIQSAGRFSLHGSNPVSPQRCFSSTLSLPHFNVDNSTSKPTSNANANFSKATNYLSLSRISQRWLSSKPTPMTPEYKLRVVTGNKRGAGTTAQVQARLIGAEGKTEMQPIHGKFDRNSVVEVSFPVDAPLGEIKKIHIGHDNIGDLGVGWYLEHVDVITPEHESLYFPIQRWLGDSDFGLDPSPSFVKVIPAPVAREAEESESLLPLEISAAAAAYPHPTKVEDGQRGVSQSRFGYAGEDAYCLCPVVHTRKALSPNKGGRLSTKSSHFVVAAVADGIYSWRNEGIDAGLYSQALVRVVQNAAQQHVSDINESDTLDIDTAQQSRPTPEALMQASEEKTSKKIRGSSTLCICCVDGEKGVLKVANLGDSGALVVRRGTVIFRTEEQEHSFGYPYQLPTDKAADAQQYSCNLFHGDTVVIGSDGLFDNITEADIGRIVRRARPRRSSRHPKNKTPMELAHILAGQAFQNSMDKSATTPYSAAASEVFNMVYSGGKMDDITCIVLVAAQER